MSTLITLLEKPTTDGASLHVEEVSGMFDVVVQAGSSMKIERIPEGLEITVRSCMDIRQLKHFRDKIDEVIQTYDVEEPEG